MSEYLPWISLVALFVVAFAFCSMVEQWAWYKVNQENAHPICVITRRHWHRWVNGPSGTRKLDGSYYGTQGFARCRWCKTLSFLIAGNP